MTKDLEKPSLVISVRFMLAVLLFLGYCFNYMQKIDMGLAIVCMVNNTALADLSRKSNLNNSSDYFNSKLKNTDGCISVESSKNYAGTFLWNKNIQGFILSAYFYGYILTQIPGGWLSFKFGGKIVLCCSMFFGSLITITLPFLARLDYKALIVGLVLTGATHGFFWSSVSSFWAYWAPFEERSRLLGMSSAGSKFGNIFALILGGFLCSHGFDGGWPSIFYIFGIMGVIWSILLFCLSTNSPSDHYFISQKEQAYILDETKKIIQTRRICQSRVPWKSIFTSKPCLAMFIGHFAHNWGNYLFLTQTPSFLKDVLKFDMKSNGFISAIPYIASLVTINLSSIISDRLVKSKKFSVTKTRRIFVSVATIFPSFAIVGLSFMNCSHVYLGVALLTIGVSLDSVMIGAGHIVNVNEIAGPYSGILFGISNTIATIPGIISPLIASVLTPHRTQKEWQVVFMICAVIYFVGGFIYVIFLDAELQPWAIIEANDSEIKAVNNTENLEINEENDVVIGNGTKN